jgi:hypothetical protein
MAQRYDRDGKVFPFYVTSTPGTGELYASAHDVARFAMFHLEDHLADQQQILTDAQIDELHRPVIRVREDRSHGVGWMLGRAFDGTPVVYHTGNQAGVVNVMMLLPSRDIACVVLTNHDDSQTYRGTWRGKVRDGENELAVVLSIADRESSLQVGGQKPERSRARLCRGICLFSPSSRSARLLLQLPTRRRQHQLHQLLGDLRLQAFRVALVETHHVGDDAAVLAAGEREDLRLARSGQQTPAGTQLVESAAVVDITRARVDDFLRSAARAAVVLLRPVGCVGHTFLVDLALSRRIYK